MKEVIIVGAGLSGLAAAYYLKKGGIESLVLEAREREGGRIHTVQADRNATPVEMGATWFAEKHTYLMQLLQELELPYFKQFQTGIGVFETDSSQEPQLFQIPNTEEASYRVAGGTAKLIQTLMHRIGSDGLILGTPLAAVTEHPDHIEIKTGKGESFLCRSLIITIPPFLLVSQDIQFNPVLPRELVHVMEHTHTWMGDSIKFAVSYESSFWRQQGYSGTVFSHSGIATEVYDHSNFEETRFALKGFLSADAAALTKEERATTVIEQLVRLLGEGAANYLSYTDQVWKQEAYTFADYGKYVMPHQYNGHSLYAQPLMHGKLYLAGTETSPHFGGYMDGAVYSGLAAAKNILYRLQKANAPSVKSVL